jgi:hypothetical protein
MKRCPECESQNQQTNLFCPSCGHSFVDEQAAPPAQKKGVRRLVPGVENRRLFMIVAIVIVVVLGLAAGITSFVVSREIERSSLVPVESGILWKCAKCAKTYKDRVTKLNVKKSEQYEYGVETVTGECYGCKYGALAGGYQDLVESLSQQGYFGGFAMDMAEKAAAYISANPSLFPAIEPATVVQQAVQADPKQVNHDFEQYAGKPIMLRGKVMSSEAVKWNDGSLATYLQVAPQGEVGPSGIDYLVLYRGAAPVAKGDTVECYVMPADQVMAKSGKGYLKAVLTIAMYLNPVKEGPASSAPAP